MTENVIVNDELVEQLDRFNTKFNEDMNEMQIKSAWFISVFHATDGEAELPYSVSYGSYYVTKYHPYPKKLVEKSWEPGEFYEVDDYGAPQEVDTDATNRLIGKIIRHARQLGHKVEKKYDDDEFTIKVILLQRDKHSYNDVYVRYVVSRKTVCEKIVTVVHHEATTKVEVIEAHDEEVITWDCGKVSFLAMNDSDTENKTKKDEPTEDFDPPESE